MCFLLNDEYMESKHIFGALCKFLRLNSERVKCDEVRKENEQTRVSFYLTDEADSILSNQFLLQELKEIIDNEKYVIIDVGLKKTIKAVKGSLIHSNK